MTAYNQRAFSLVELVMILVIIGVLAVVAIPRFADRGVFDARSYAEDFANALRYARKVAIASGCGTQVTLSGGAYVIQRREAFCSGAFVNMEHPSLGNVYVGAPAAGVSVVPAAAVVQFSPLGVASLGGSLTVSAGATSFTVTLVAATGYVEVN